MSNPVLYSFPCWASSQLSIARHTGGCTVNGTEYLTIFDPSLSVDAIGGKHQPDLLDARFRSAYKALGRDEFLAAVASNSGPDITDEDRLRLVRNVAKNRRAEAKKPKGAAGKAIEEKADDFIFPDDLESHDEQK